MLRLAATLGTQVVVGGRTYTFVTNLGTGTGAVADEVKYVGDRNYGPSESSGSGQQRPGWNWRWNQLQHA